MERRIASGIGRPLEPSVPSNRAVLVGTLAAGAGTLAVCALAGRRSPVRSAVASAEACFTAWAIGRELDPDEPSTANLAMALALLGRTLGRPGLGASFSTLLATRLAAGTVGAPLGPTDGAQVAGAALMAGTRAATWPAVPALAIGLARDGGLGDRTGLGVAATAVGGLVGALAARAHPRIGSPGKAGLAWLAAVGGAGAMALPAAPVRSQTDVGERPLETRRVTLARGIALGTVALGTLLDGRRGLIATLPVGAALLGSAATRLAGRLDRTSAGAEADTASVAA